ncbi:MAG: hypothetical protein U0670_10660 [Anaerolineae bacterium]
MRRTFLGLTSMIIVLTGLFSLRAHPVYAQGASQPGSGNHVYLWGDDGTLLNQFDYADDQYVVHVWLNDDGTHVMVALMSGEIIVYDVSGPRPEQIADRTFAPPESDGYNDPRIRGSIHSTRVLIVEYQHSWLWDYATDTVLQEIDSLWTKISPDGSQILLGDETGVQLMDAETGDLGAKIEFEAPRDEAWSPDGTKLALLSPSGVAIADISDPAAAQIVYEQHDENQFHGGTSTIAWSPDGSALMVVANPLENTGLQGRVLLIDTASLTDRFQLSFPHLIASAAWSSDSSRLLLTLVDDAFYYVHDAIAGDPLSAAALPSPVASAEWTPDEDRIFTVTDGYAAYSLIDTATNALLYDRPQEDLSVGYGYVLLKWSPDRSAVAALLMPTNTLEILHVEDYQPDEPVGPPILSVLPHADTILGMVWSGDGSRIVTFTGVNFG